MLVSRLAQPYVPIRVLEVTNTHDPYVLHYPFVLINPYMIDSILFYEQLKIIHKEGLGD